MGLMTQQQACDILAKYGEVMDDYWNLCQAQANLYGQQGQNACELFDGYVHETLRVIRCESKSAVYWEDS